MGHLRQNELDFPRKAGFLKDGLQGLHGIARERQFRHERGRTGFLVHVDVRREPEGPTEGHGVGFLGVEQDNRCSPRFRPEAERVLGHEYRETLP
jgi:hypothetical protein